MKFHTTDFPRRNEIWLFQLSAALGSEWGAGSTRPGLVVSSDAINKGQSAIVVALMTSLTITDDLSGEEEESDRDYRVDRLPRSVVVLNLKRNRLRRSGRNYEVKWIGSKHWTWANRTIVDCSQLVTVTVPPPSERSAQDEIVWDGPRARLADPLAIEDINSALQAVLGGCIGRSFTPTELVDPYRPLAYEAGDIIQVELPDRRSRLCLVVSSSSIDLLREHIYRSNRRPRPMGREDDGPWPWGHLTVVPLAPELGNESVGFPYTRVTILGCPYAILCSELYTIDWRVRQRTISWTARLQDDAMSLVRRAIRMSLALPT